MNELVKKDGIAEKIYLIRGVQVMLDCDLADSSRRQFGDNWKECF